MTIGANAKLGYTGFLGVAEQTAFGTKITSTNFMEFISEGFMRDITEQKIETINTTRDFRQRVLLDENVSGSIETHLNVDEDAQMFLLKQAMGGTVSSAQVAATAAYAHTFTLGDMENNQSSAGAADVKALTFQVRKGDTHIFDFVGCRVNSFVLSAEAGGMCNMSAELIGKSASLSTDSLTATFTENLPATYRNVTITLTGTAEEFISFELTINNNLISDSNSRALGSKELSVLPPGNREISLKMLQRFDTTTAYTRFINEQTVQGIITIDTGVTIGAAGSSTYSMVITLPKLYLNSNMPQNNDKGILTHELNFTAIVSTITGYAMQVQVNNDTTSY